MRQIALDIAALLGFAAFLYGLWRAYQPAAFMVGGLVVLGVALLLSRAARAP